MKIQKSKFKSQKYNSKFKISLCINSHSNISKGVFTVTKIANLKTFGFLLSLLIFAFYFLTFASQAYATIPSYTSIGNTSITNTTAVVNSNVNPNSLFTTVSYRYDTSNVTCSNLTFSTSYGPIGSGSSPVFSSVSLTNLTPNHLYYFCVTATNFDGTMYSSTGSFNTTSNGISYSSSPTSGNYKLMDYGFGAGGTATSSSSNYSLFGTVGQVDQGSPSSSNYFIGAGLEYTLQASVSAAPTFTNSSNWYNKLKIVINRGGADPSDTQYAIRIASGSGQFQYVQNDNTVGSVLGLEDWQTYGAWGGTAGSNIIGLYPGTTYTVQISAKQGQFFTQFMWSPASSASTTNPSLSFDIDIAPLDQSTSPPYTLNIGQLSPGSVTTANDKVWVSLATNATNGGLIYILGTNTGLLSSTVSHTITAVSSDLGNVGVSEGYGVRNNSVTQASGGPMEAVAPYNGASDNVGILDTAKRTIYDSTGAPVVGGRVSFLVKAKASNTTPSAADYADTLTVLATGSF